MLHEFLSSIQNSSSRLTAPASTAEEYVDKLTAQAELIGREKALDMACTEVHNLYALLDDFRIKVPDVDRASYATLDSSYALLKTIMEELDGNKEEAVQKYSAELEAGEEGGSRATHPGDCCDRVSWWLPNVPRHAPLPNTHHSASLLVVQHPAGYCCIKRMGPASTLSNNHSYPAPAGVEAVAKDVQLLRTEAQNEAFLSDASNASTVVPELESLAEHLRGSAAEMARINRFQKLFKVGAAAGREQAPRQG
jgi:hypothetical protein